MTIRNIKCEVVLADMTQTQWLAQLLRAAIAKSRFKADFLEIGVRKPYIKVDTVRLRESKHYCGNHPNACNVNIGRKPRRGAFLEGADWVEFDDLINDVCDEHYVECDFISMDGAGKRWVLRDGRKRRVYYESAYNRGPHHNAEWIATMDDGDFEDHFGATGVPASTFPEGTPGIHTKAGYAEADHH